MTKYINLKKVVSGYSIVIGLSIFGMWAMFWITGNIPELETEPLRAGSHLIAELTTAGLLIFGGITLIRKWKYALNLFQVSMGMLIYTLIQSPGYFAEQDEFAFVGMFSVLLIITGVLLVWSIKVPEDFR